MRFGYMWHVTDVPGLAALQAARLGAWPTGSDDCVEPWPDGAILAIVSHEAAAQIYGGSWPAAAGSNRSTILGSKVTDANAERGRSDGLVSNWLQQPKTMPWGHWSMLCRDPNGNPVDVFSAADGGNQAP